MGLLTLPLQLPFLPIQGVLKLAGVIQEEVEQELHNPAAARKQLEEVAAEEEAGEISEEQAAEEERAATERLIGPGSPATGGPGERGK